MLQRTDGESEGNFEAFASWKALVVGTPRHEAGAAPRKRLPALIQVPRLTAVVAGAVVRIEDPDKAIWPCAVRDIHFVYDDVGNTCRYA